MEDNILSLPDLPDEDLAHIREELRQHFGTWRPRSPRPYWWLRILSLWWEYYRLARIGLPPCMSAAIAMRVACYEAKK